MLSKHWYKCCTKAELPLWKLYGLNRWETSLNQEESWELSNSGQHKKRIVMMIYYLWVEKNMSIETICSACTWTCIAWGRHSRIKATPLEKKIVLGCLWFRSTVCSIVDCLFLQMFLFHFRKNTITEIVGKNTPLANPSVPNASSSDKLNMEKILIVHLDTIFF